LVIPPTTWVNEAIAASRAVVRLSPNRSPGGSEAVVGRRRDHPFEGGRVGQAVLALTERGEEAGVGSRADPAQRPPVVGGEPPADPEVVRVVDGGFHPQRLAVLEIGLDLLGLVPDAQLRVHPVGDHRGGEPAGGRPAASGADLPVEEE
jgi:hypothetical protein